MFEFLVKLVVIADRVSVLDVAFEFILSLSHYRQGVADLADDVAHYHYSYMVEGNTHGL